MKLSTIRYGTLIVGFAVFRAVAFAQEISHIRGERVCGDCVIQRFRLATLHDTTFPGGAITQGEKIYVTNARSFLVYAAGATSGELFFGNASGEIVRRIAAPGAGPGEYLAPEYVTESDTELIVYDPRLRRFTHYSKDDFTPVTTVAAPPITVSAPPLRTTAGAYVLAGTLRTRQGVGYTLHVVSSDGQIVRSFRDRDTWSNSPAVPPFLVSPAGDSAVWVADYNRYVLEKWDLNGNLKAIFERHVDWFPARDKRFNATAQWFGTLLGLWQDDAGRLWAHINRRKLVASRATVDRAGQVGSATVPLLDMNPASFESIIEVLDPVRGVVIATSKVAGEFYPVWGGGFYDTFSRSLPSGERIIDIFAYNLRATR